MAKVFDPELLKTICAKSMHLPLEEQFDALTADLAAAYPGKIDAGPRKWLFNNAGGAMGQIALLHASTHEYLLLFGTPIGTSGHSGRYRTDVFDVILKGEMWTYIQGETEKTVTLPGEMAFLGPKLAKGYRALEGTWMLEYSRGPIPTMLPFGLADTVFSTLDVQGLVGTLWVYTRLVFKNMFGRPL